MANGTSPCARNHTCERYPSGACIECDRENRARWRRGQREKLAAKTAQWKAENPDKVQDYLSRTRETRRIQGTRANWRRKGLQPTRRCPANCECCGGDNNGRTLHLDHDHVTGKFRGWLCTCCNTGIGKLGDSIAGVRRALAYLSNSKE